MAFLLLLMTTMPTSLSGGAGWVGTSILSGVLGWLLFVHLPGKDKQLKELLTSHQTSLETKDRAHEVAIKEIFANVAAREKERREEFRESLAQVISHCERNEQRMTEALKSSLAEVNKNLVELRNVLISQSRTNDVV